jgi:hypothetical protein
VNFKAMILGTILVSEWIYYVFSGGPATAKPSTPPELIIKRPSVVRAQRAVPQAEPPRQQRDTKIVAAPLEDGSLENRWREQQ